VTRLSPRELLLRLTVTHAHLDRLAADHDLHDPDDFRVVYEVVLGLVFAGNLAREFEQANPEFAGAFPDVIRVRDKLAHLRSYDDISVWRVSSSVDTVLASAAERAQALLARLRPA